MIVRSQVMTKCEHVRLGLNGTNVVELLACIWPKIRSVGADFDFICTYQYKEWLGSREHRGIHHTDESSEQFQIQLTCRIPGQTSLCNDITTLYQRPSLPGCTMDVLKKSVCVDSKYLCHLEDPPKGNFLSGWKLLHQLNTHTFLYKWAVAEINLYLIHFYWALR